MHAGMKTPEQFTPTDADFCIITFRLLPSPFLNRASREQHNKAVWNVTGEAADNGQVGQKGATTCGDSAGPVQVVVQLNWHHTTGRHR